MSFIKKGASALSKLLVVMALAATFAVGLTGVVYISLQGEEIKVPEIVGKDVKESEAELAALGLKIKSRASRFSNEKPNTVLEQLPKAGDTVKTGQMILVVTSKTNPEGEEAPATIKKSTEQDDTEKIEELISDKPKKSNKANTNTNSNKKKTSTTRDVLSNADGKSNSNSSDTNSNKTNSNANSTKDGKNAPINTNKAANPIEQKKTNTETKPAAKTSDGGARPGKTP
ncbi:MAG TPA: PASTA domain-containing protein [Pyrinomonadaceae bacterium]|nr:PASTA domain-containing protein [Pyrinomonadaceae bacterium]